MSLTVVEFDLAVPPKCLHPNGRAKPFMVRKAKRGYQSDCAIEVRDAKRQYESVLPIKSAMVFARFTLPSGLVQHQHDKDNLIAWLKFAIDVFEKEGVIHNDRDLHYRSPVQVIGQRPRLRISLMVINETARTLMDDALDKACEGLRGFEAAFVRSMFEVK